MYFTLKIELIMKKLFILLLMPSVLFLSSCGDDDDEVVDFRLASVGSYNYTSEITLKADANITDTDNGTLDVAINGSELSITLDGDKLILNGVTEASNGYGFNINSITLTDGDGDNFVVRGVTSTTIGSSQYHGFFDSGSKQIRLNLETDYQNNQFDVFNATIEILATKK